MMNPYGMMDGYAGGFSLITVVLFWILMALGIAALWKYISKK